jgi:hypothetical protein
MKRSGVILIPADNFSVIFDPSHAGRVGARVIERRDDLTLYSSGSSTDGAGR